ncbi:hypothetical protein, partial [Klebsiella pneumoniae]|uniref:hypothetical protein n=1 Tax=Klebsiella pneumoniae TaxID=573 RepID=UPI003013B2ED
ANLIKPCKAGRLVNQIKKLAEDVGRPPRLKRSLDPGDNYLLALAEAGKTGADLTAKGMYTKHLLQKLKTRKSRRLLCLCVGLGLAVIHI